MAIGARHCTLRFMELEMKSSLSSPPLYGRGSVHFSNSSLRYHQSCSLSMNGCQGDTRTPIGTIETRTLPAVSSPVLAMESLNSAISDMVKSQSPPYGSGIIRLEVPIQEQIEALEWLHAQNHLLLPRCFFSGRRQSVDSEMHFIDHINGSSSGEHNNNKVVEFDELEGSSIIAATVAWDNAASWTYQKAVDALRATIWQVSSVLMRVQKRIPHSRILANTHVPGKASWEQAVKRALQIISRNDSKLIKVVLARSTRVVTAADIDPLTWLACLKVEGENAYQFCLQPPQSPAFIGNTPEQLFHRDRLSICSEALAGTRARGRSELLDLKIGQDLLSSDKDHNEFTIVRECIRRKLEAVCSDVLIEPKKAIRKFTRVQHLYARLRGRLQSEDDEFKILSSVHPTPAVCGYPTEDARAFISETEMFDRGMYAGPVGWFGGEESEFAVGIRSALVEKGLGALIYAGTGIVEGSDSSLEWEELELKTSQFTKLMKLEEPFFTRGQNRTINQNQKVEMTASWRRDDIP